MLSASFLGRKLKNELLVRLRVPFGLEFVLFGGQWLFERVSCIPDWPQIHYVAEDFELLIPLPILLGITGISPTMSQSCVWPLPYCYWCYLPLLRLDSLSLNQ